MPLTGLEVGGNTAADGGALFVGTGAVGCFDSDLVQNSADVGGAASIFEGVLTSDGCDLGVGDDDNSPVDLHLVLGQLDVDDGAEATFTRDVSCR